MTQTTMREKIMNRYDEDYEEDYGDIRDQVPKLTETCYFENEEGEEEEVDVEIDPKLLEIVDSQVYAEKSDDSMGEEVEHTLEGEIGYDGNSYFVEMRIWEYPVNAVDNYEVVSIEKL